MGASSAINGWIRTCERGAHRVVWNGKAHGSNALEPVTPSNYLLSDYCELVAETFEVIYLANKTDFNIGSIKFTL